MRIGEVADRAGVNIQTMRYYERRRLVLPVRRRASGYREYHPDTPARVRFIKRAQDLGFSLQEVGELLGLRDRPSADAAHVRRVVRAKVADIDQRVQRLARMRGALVEMLDACERECATRPFTRCAIVEALDDADQDHSIQEERCTSSN